MRTTRAFLAGLGVTGSLVAAVVCAFVVASAVVAYKGFPGLAPPQKVAGLVVDDAPLAVAAKAKASAKPLRVRTAPLPAATSAPRTVAASRTVVTPPSSAGRPVPQAPSGPSAPVPSVQPSGTPTQPAPAGGNGGSQPASPPPTDGGKKTEPVTQLPQPVQQAAGQTTDLVTGTTDGLGDALDHTVGGLGQAVGQVSPTLGGAVTGAGHLVGGTVHAVGNTVGGVVGGLLGGGS